MWYNYINGGGSMTLEEQEKFFEDDKGDYKVDTNNNFLGWYRLKLNTGYNPYLYVDDIQNLVDKIKVFYEETYLDENLKNQTANKQNIDKLKSLLTINEVAALDCKERTNSDDQSSFTDISLREKIIKISSSNILYSKDHTPDFNALRAKIMISDFNSYYGLNIPTNNIDLLLAKAKTKAGTSQEVIRKAIIYTPKTPDKKNKFKKK